MDTNRSSVATVEPGGYGVGRQVEFSFEDAIERATASLKEQGFGVLTTIDVQQTLKSKIGLDSDPYTILGACNPHLAHRALGVVPELGLLLPCNVIVRQTAEGVRVSYIDPTIMLGVAGEDPVLAEVANDAAEGLAAALASI